MLAIRLDSTSEDRYLRSKSGKLEEQFGEHEWENSSTLACDFFLYQGFD